MAEPGIPFHDRRRGARRDEVVDLLQDVARFRAALDADLTVAAAAAEAVDEQLAGPELPASLTVAAAEDGHRDLTRLQSSLPPPEPRQRVRPVNRAVPAILAAALGLAGGLLAGHGVPGHGVSGGRAAIVTAGDSSLARLSSAVGTGNLDAAQLAGRQLAAEVAALIAVARVHPEAAQQAATLLLAERTVVNTLSGAVGLALQRTVADQARALQAALAAGDELATLASPAANPTVRMLLSLLPAAARPLAVSSVPDLHGRSAAATRAPVPPVGGAAHPRETLSQAPRASATAATPAASPAAAPPAAPPTSTPPVVLPLEPTPGPAGDNAGGVLHP